MLIFDGEGRFVLELVFMYLEVTVQMVVRGMMEEGKQGKLL